MKKVLDIHEKPAILVEMKESTKEYNGLLEKYEPIKTAVLEKTKVQKILPYKPRSRIPKSPKFRFASTNEFFLEGSLKQGFNPENILKKFKEKMLEKEQQSAKYEQQQNERRAKANKKKEEDSAQDK